MRFLFFKILIFSVLTSKLPAQWTTVQTNAQYDILAVHAFDANTWWLGTSHETLRSNDFGANWNRYPLATNGIPLLGSVSLDFHFFSATSGITTGLFSLGNDEFILRTGNGGQTWTTANLYQNGNPPRYLNDLFFLDANTGWAVGANGRILKTTNGGLSWSVQSTGNFWEINAIAFTSPTKGFAASIGGLLRSTDGGSTWTPDPTLNFYLSKIQFVTPTLGFLGGGGILKKTNDGGTTWTDVPQPIGGTYVEDLWFADATTGYLLSPDAVFRTTDGGQIWEKRVLERDPDLLLNRFFWLDKNRGMVVGDNGLCFKTSNGGAGEWSPTAAFEPGAGFTNCAGVPQPLVNLTPNVPGYTYQWWLDGQLFSTERNPSVTFPEVDTPYKITLVAANGTATDTAIYETSTQFIPTLFIPDLEANPSPVCRGELLILKTNFALDWGAEWELLANGVVIEKNFQGDFTRHLTPLETTTYTLHGRLTHACGVSEKTTSLTVPVTPLPLPDEFKPYPERVLICEGDSTRIVVENTIPGAVYQWTVNSVMSEFTSPGGTFFIQTGPVGFEARYSFTVIYDGCYRQFWDAAVVKTEPVLTVQHYPFYSKIAGETFALGNWSYGATFEWDFGPAAQPTTSTEQTPTVRFADPGLYTVRQIAHNTVGCHDTSFTTVEVFPADDLPEISKTVCASGPSGLQFVNHYLIDKILDTYADAAGNVYVLGYRFEPYSWWFTYNLFYNKYAPDGTLQWSRYVSPYSHGNDTWYSFYQCLGTSIAADAAGNVYLGGSFAGKNMKLGGQPVFTETDPSTVNGFLAKLDPAGNLLWSARLLGPGGFANLAPTELEFDASGQLVALVSGHFLKIQHPAGEEPGGSNLAGFNCLRFDTATGALKKIVPVGSCDFPGSSIGGFYNPDPGTWNTAAITRVGPRMQRLPNDEWVASGFFTGSVVFGQDTVHARSGVPLNVFVARLGSNFEMKKTFRTFGTNDNYQNGTGNTDRLILLPFATDAQGHVYQSVSLRPDELSFEELQNAPDGVGVAIFLEDSLPEAETDCHFLLKYDPQGQLVWVQRNGDFLCSHLTTGGDGNVYGLVGYPHVLGLNDIDGRKYGKARVGQRDVAVVGWRPDGSLAGVIELATPEYDHEEWLARTQDGRLVALYSQGGSLVAGDTTGIQLSIFDPTESCPPVAVDEPDAGGAAGFDFQIIPNPASGSAMLVWKGQFGGQAVLRVSDAFGRLVFFEKIGDPASGQHSLELGGWPEGVFFVEILSEKKVRAVRKLVVVR